MKNENKNTELITRADYFKKSALISTRSNQPLTMSQKKLLNVMFKTIDLNRKTVLPNSNTEVYYFPYEEVKEYPGCLNETELTRELEGLQSLKQELNIFKKDGTLSTKIKGWVVLFPYVGKINRYEDDKLTGSGFFFETHHLIDKYIKEDKNSPFARLNFETCMSFKGKYTTNFYEFLIDYIGAEKYPKMSIETLRDILTIPQGKYSRFQSLEEKVIKPSLDELRLYGIDASYSIEKFGVKIGNIIFEVKGKNRIKESFSIDLKETKEIAKKESKKIKSSLTARDLEFCFRWDEKKTLKQIYENIAYYSNLNYSEEEIEDLLDKSDYKKWSNVKKFFDTTTGEFTETMRPAIFDCNFGSTNFESWADIFISWKKKQ